MIELSLKIKAMLEAQQIRIQENPNLPLFTIAADAGPVRMLALLDKLIQQEAAERAAD